MRPGVVAIRAPVVADMSQWRGPARNGGLPKVHVGAGAARSTNARARTCRVGGAAGSGDVASLFA